MGPREWHGLGPLVVEGQEVLLLLRLAGFLPPTLQPHGLLLTTLGVLREGYQKEENRHYSANPSKSHICLFVVGYSLNAFIFFS